MAASRRVTSIALLVLNGPLPLGAMHLQDEPEPTAAQVTIDSTGTVFAEPVQGQWGLIEEDDVNTFRDAVQQAEDGVPVSDSFVMEEVQSEALTSQWFGRQRFSLRFDPADDENATAVMLDNESETGTVFNQAAYESTPWEKYFNRDVCLKHREQDAKSSYFVWCQDNKPIIYSRKYNFAYMKTPKAASTAFFAYFKKMFGDAKEIEHEQLPDDAYVFTFVRRPLEQKLSAFAEVDLKQEAHKEYGNNQKTKFQDVERGLDAGRARFSAFLDDLKERRFSPLDKRMPMHAASQIAGVLCTRKVDFIGHLERATVDWARIQKDANLPQEKRTKVVPIVHEGEKQIYEYDEHVKLNTMLEDKICSMYQSDFACLGYTAPQHCQKFGLP